jgi:AbrB family looped-hinge helix DNA binding protein
MIWADDTDGGFSIREIREIRGQKPPQNSEFQQIQFDILLYSCITFRMIQTSTTDTVSFGTKGQVVIPRRLRREFEIEEGTKATVVATPDGILLKPITGAYIKSLRGSLKGTKVMDAFLAERKREREL